MPDWLLLLFVLSGCLFAIPGITLGLFVIGHRIGLAQMAERGDAADRNHTDREDRT